MSEQEQPATHTDPVTGVTVDANGEVIEPDEELEHDAPIEADDDPDEEEAEAEAAAEREKELAAERQEEAASIEAQAREQDAKRKKLDQLAAHVAKRYGDILGSDLDGFVHCPLCLPWFPGIRLPVMPDYETVAAVKVAIGEDPDPPLVGDLYSRECEACAGLGKVLTGSHVNGQQTAQCIPCKGRGWVSIGPEREAGAITAAVAPVGNGEVPAVPVSGDEPPEAAALKALGYIVVAPVTTPEAI